MKNTLILILLIVLPSTFSGQNTNSVLSKGVWYKFSINKSGVFKIDATFLSNLGVNIGEINPKHIKIYGNGVSMLPESINEVTNIHLEENSIFVSGENDNSFDANDYILFYGKGPHDWELDALNNNAEHIQNIYSDKSYYFLTIDDALGKRVQNSNTSSINSSAIVREFDDFIFYEKEEVNLLALGRLWFGEAFAIENNKRFSFEFNNVTNDNIRIRVAGVAQSTTSSTMSISANGQNVPALTFPPVSSSTTSGLARYDVKQGEITPSNTIDITIDYNNNGNPSARAYLDYIEIIGKKELIANSNQFSFRSFDVANGSGNFTYEIQNSNAVFQVWDVTNSLNPVNLNNISQGANVFSFNASGGDLREYVMLNDNDFYTPELLSNSVIANQNLRGLKDIQYLVITTDELLGEAQRLSNYHQSNSNLTATTVTLSKIYNEFGAGTPDVTSIRNFIKYLHDNSSQANKLQYVCFFGDSSYDFKDRISGNNNIVPTFHATQSFDLVSSYVTDDFYVMIDDTDGNMLGSDTIDIASGRIPVTTITEAKNVVDKILSYYSVNSFGDWRNTVTFLADDIDANSDISLQEGLEEVADSIKKYKPTLNINKIYADAYPQETSSGGERYPQVSNAVTNTIEKGTLVFNYFGHGGEDGLASERLLDIPQIQAFNNFNSLPLFITVTCEFSRFDNPLRDTAGEQLFLNSNGGAVSMITTTRDVYISLGEVFNKRLTKYVLSFEGNEDSIAENLIKAKNETVSNQRFFIFFFGDPAMHLAIPKPNIRISKINDIDVTQSLDTLKALSKIKIEGVVTDASNNIIPDFNGTISTTIFDKSIDKQTLDNDNFGVVNTFDSQESKLFKGKATVTNGNFNFDFIVPKDIKTAYGNGKVSMYAENQKIDKGGVNYDIVVGGINNNAPEDNVGPEIFAFMNDESFIDGSTTNASPNLIIKLSDVSGINTSITAIDHDIVAILDNNQAEPIILNDYYETELDDYTKGKISYQLRNLSVGLHNLRIKAWDTYNNSSEITLVFEVVSDSGLTISNVLNYPNPFTTYTEFWFNHNKPNKPLQVQVQVFTVSGKLVKTINQRLQTEGSLSRTIVWNGLDDFGSKLAKGVYMYKLKITSTSENLSVEKFEKLVIL